MSYLTKLKLNGTYYDLRDQEAYNAINILNGDSSVAGSVANQINNAINNLQANNYRVVEELPTPDEADFGVIYLLAEEGTKSGSYTEYIKVQNLDGSFQLEKIGSTDIDLTDYAKKSDMANVISTILTVNEFELTEDLIEQDGYQYVTVYDNGTATTGINRTNESNKVYKRENTVKRSELAELASTVSDLATKEDTDIQTVNNRIDQEVSNLNQQSGIASYITIEMESGNTGTISVTNVDVLKPASSIVKSDTSWYNESATEYTLGSLSQLKGLSDLVMSGKDFNDVSITLDSDIDGEYQEFKPIGDINASNTAINIYGANESALGDRIFKGTFDGQGHTIKNLRIVQSVGVGSNNAGVGLFGIVANGSTIENINLENVTIDTDAKMVGGIVGYVAKTTNAALVTTIRNCHITGNINITGDYGVGGIIGRNESGNGTLVIQNCSVIGNSSNSSKINATYKNSFVGVGGIIGALYSSNANNIIENCIVQNVTVEAPSEAIGGIAGHFEMGTLNNNTVSNVVLTNNIDTNVYMQEAVTVGALAGTIDSSIRQNSGSIRTHLTNNTIADCTIQIPSTYTNTDNAAGVLLDSNGYPAWESWPVIGTPRNVESKDPTSFITCDVDWNELKSGITIEMV